MHRGGRVVLFRGSNHRPHLPHGIAEADREHRLPRVLQNVENLFGRSFQIKSASIGKHVIFRGAADRLSQAFTEFALEETHNSTDTLKRKAFVPQLAYHCSLCQVLHRIQAAMALAHGYDNAAFVPPLQLPRGDAGEGDYITRCKELLHCTSNTFQTIEGEDV